MKFRPPGTGLARSARAETLSVEVEIAHEETQGDKARGAALFPIWSTSVFRLVLVLGVLGVVSIPAALWAWERTPYVSGVSMLRPQPVKFDHRHHARDDGIACMYCHSDAARSASAGMPATSLCMGCHSQIWTNSPELAPVRQAYFSDAPLAWNRVTRLPHFVYFNHSIHVAKGVGCVTCHGRVDRMAQVYPVEPFTMDFCLDCHRAPDARLRPLTEITNMEWQPSGSPAESGARLRQQLNVQPPTDCTTCHR
ncbi:MAG: cytochrome c3 family protein [Polyangiaceae bacterium]